MAFGDGSPPPEKPSTVQIERVNAENAPRGKRSSLGDKAISIFLAQAEGKDVRTTGRDASSVTVENLGQVGALNVPPGWIAVADSRRSGGIGTRSLSEFHPPDDPNAKLSLFYRGLPQEDRGGAFQRVMDQRPHALSPQEVKSLDKVLRERADPAIVDLKSAKTQELNGKKVLIIEGHYKETGTNIKEILVDAGGDGQTVQEIYFQAPEKSYQKYSSLADEAMRSIKWR